VVAGRPLTNALPAVVWSVIDNEKRNAFTLWQDGLDFSIHYRVNTDNWGTFNFGLDGNQIFNFKQGLTHETAFTIVDGVNNGRQLGVEFTGIASVGWRLAPFSAQLQVQLAHPFSIANTNFPYNLAGPGRATGFQHIGPLYTANLHMAYDMPSEWITGAGMRVFANLNNILNTPPPYGDTIGGIAAVANGAGGGATGTNPIGRMVVVGLTKDF
jgi:hypothetical protein